MEDEDDGGFWRCSGVKKMVSRGSDGPLGVGLSYWEFGNWIRIKKSQIRAQRRASASFTGGTALATEMPGQLMKSI
ncbi:hypothetical protein Syun_014024 [Stephania yunnanensis]|uniref:Uncharacterized protein n=1 Tax=Stephania yunnanensis TaxID=152371 RepID=A0AAP0P963_9MAGN